MSWLVAEKRAGADAEEIAAGWPVTLRLADSCTRKG